MGRTPMPPPSSADNPLTFAPTTARTVTDPQIESLFLREQDEATS